MQSTCLTGGLRLGVLGSAASLAIAAPLLVDPYSTAAATDASRIGLYFGRAVGSEKIGVVVMGVEAFNVTATNVNFNVAVNLPAAAANTLLAGPTVGAAATPTFRTMVAADLPNTTVTPGAYTSANITVDAQGRITLAANGGAGVTGSGTANKMTRWTGATTLGNSSLGDDGSTITGTIPIRLGPAAVPADFGSLFEAVYDAPAKNTGFSITIYSDTYNPNFTGRRARGTGAAPTAVQSGDVLSSYGAVGYGTTAFPSSGRAKIQMQAAEAWTDIAQGSNITFFTTPVGGLLTSEMARFTAAGALRLGVPSARTGSLIFANVGTAFLITLQADTTTPASYTLTLPAAQGGAGTYLKNDGAGALSWAAATPTLTATYVGYGSGSNALTGSTKLTWDSVYGTLTITGVVTDSATPTPMLALYGAANTKITATTETFDLDFKLDRTVQWATTPPVTQRAFLVRAPTYSCDTAAKTITTAATFAIEGAPVASGLTITNPYALWVQSGAARIDQGTITSATNPALLINCTWNHATAGFYGLSVNVVASTPNSGATAAIGVKQSGSDVFWVNHYGNIYTDPGVTNGTVVTDPYYWSTMYITCGQGQNIPGNAEIKNIVFDFSKGFLFTEPYTNTKNRAFVLIAPNYTISGAGGTMPTAATMAIEAAPTANAGVTITNAYALWIQKGLLALGTKSAQVGQMVFNNATNDFAVTIQSGVTSASYTLTLPTAQGGASTFLSNNGAGVLSWAAASAALTATYVGFGDAGGALTGVAGWTFAVQADTSYRRAVNTGTSTAVAAGIIDNHTYAHSANLTSGPLIGRNAVLTATGSPTANTYHYVGSHDELIVNPGAAMSTTVIGARHAVTKTTSVANYGNGLKMYGDVTNATYATSAAGVVALNTICGIQINLSTTVGATSEIAAAYGLQITSASTLGTFTDYFSIYVPSPTTTGTMGTNYYGLYIQDTTARNLIGGTLSVGVVSAITKTFAVKQQTYDTGVCQVFTLLGSNVTNQTNATEITDVDWNLSHTIQWATGVPTTNRTFRIQAPTLTCTAGSKTVTTAATMAIAGAPVSSASVAITNQYSLWVESGSTLLASGTVTTTAREALKITQTWNNAGVDFNGIALDFTNTASGASTTILAATVGGGSRFSFFKNGGLTIYQGIDNAVVPVSALDLECAAHTLVNSTFEAKDVYFNLARTVQWATNVPTTQRAVYITAPTYDCNTGGKTITTAATLAINAAPSGTANVTITNPYALWVQAGRSAFGGSVSVTQGVAAGLGYLAARAFVVNTAALTTVTASNEVFGAYFNLAATIQWATNVPTTNRALFIEAPTYDCDTGGKTITTAATLAINAAPSGTANVAITNNLACWIQAGATSIEGLGAARATANADTVLTKATFYFTFTGSTAAQTITLPSGVLYGASRTQMIYIRNKSSVSVTVAAAGGQTIDGAASIVLPAGAGICVLGDGAGAWDSN